MNKCSDTVRHGGRAIGGSVDIDTGLVSRRMEDKDQEIELLRHGINDADAQGFRVNFNYQESISSNLQMSTQPISHFQQQRGRR